MNILNYSGTRYTNSTESKEAKNDEDYQWKIDFLLKSFSNSTLKDHVTWDEESHKLKSYQRELLLMLSPVIIQIHKDTRIYSLDIDENASQIFTGIGEKYTPIFERQINCSGLEYILKRDENFAVCDREIYSVKHFSRDNKSFLLKASSNNVYVLNVKDMNYGLESYQHSHATFVQTMDVESNSLYFATGSYDGTFCMFDFNYSTPLRKLPCSENHNSIHPDSITVVKFHPYSRYLAVGSTDKCVMLWSVDDSKPVRFFPHESYITTCEFSPDGKYLASADYDGTVKIWDVKNDGTPIREFKHQMKENDLSMKENNLSMSSLSFHPNIPVLASCNKNISYIRIWNYSFKSGEDNLTVEEFPEIPLFVRFLKDGQLKVILREFTDDGHNE